MIGRPFNPATDEPNCISDDIECGERLIPLSRVNDLPWIPRRSGSKPVHITAIYKWADSGAKGKVLETAPGPIKATTEGALRRFWGIPPQRRVDQRKDGA